MKVKNEQPGMQKFTAAVKRNFFHLTENWPIKIICLVLAIFLSEFYRGTLLDKKYLVVPLKLENDGRMAPAEQYPNKIKLTVWGEATGIGSINEDDVSAFINISDFTAEGVYRIPVQIRLSGNVAPLGNVEIGTEPAILSLRLETSARKQIPVTLSLKGIPADGYEVTESSIEPSTVEITGPASLVEKTDELVTESLSVEARTNGFSGTAAIVNDNPLISIIGRAQVQHTVKISETIMQKQFENIPLYFEKTNRDLTVTSDKKTGSLEIQGPKKLLERLTLPENILTVSCETITEAGVYTIPVVPILSGEHSKLKIRQYAPKSVQVTAEAVNEAESKEPEWSSDWE